MPPHAKEPFKKKMFFVIRANRATAQCSATQHPATLFARQKWSNYSSSTLLLRLNMGIVSHIMCCVPSSGRKKTNGERERRAEILSYLFFFDSEKTFRALLLTHQDQRVPRTGTGCRWQHSQQPCQGRSTPCAWGLGGGGGGVPVEAKKSPAKSCRTIWEYREPCNLPQPGTKEHLYRHTHGFQEQRPAGAAGCCCCCLLSCALRNGSLAMVRPYTSTHNGITWDALRKRTKEQTQ